jgi:predicted  nucleic acid-binding Zn-ribbon protein
MPTSEERLGVVETKVAHLNEKVDDIKQEVKDTQESISTNHKIMMKKLDDMEDKYEINREAFYDKLDKRKDAEDEAHKNLTKKITELQDFKMKWVYIVSGVAIAIGWIGAHGEAVLKLLK